jgi:arylsulfatase
MLNKLKAKFKKTPNIIYILADDVGWGELGWQGGGKHRGTPTPVLDKMAKEGMRFWSAYAEPSCTPTRTSIMTGRHPIRTGLLGVLWPGQTEGLNPKEKSIAKVLSEGGYHTAMWGKWHLGEEAKYSPVKHGFDYAYYGLFNGAPDAWQSSYTNTNKKPSQNIAPFFDFPGNKEYKRRTGIDLSVAAYSERKGMKRKAVTGKAGILGPERQAAFEKESIKQITTYIKDKAKSDKPFFIYWATFTQQLSGASDYQNAPGVDKANPQASFMYQHNMQMKQLFETLKKEGIAENTLVVWYSDNGPMYGFWPNSGYSWLRGGKGQVFEGGIRVPAMAWWPGMIKPDQDPDDMIHVTDLYTTAARISDSMDKVPTDRVIDGIDQTSLLLLGEGHSRRNYMFHYSGAHLGAIRYEDSKVHLLKGHGGLPGLDYYNIKRDPGEKHGGLYRGLFAVTPIQNFLKEHKLLMKKFPNRVSENIPKGAELTAHD